MYAAAETIKKYGIYSYPKTSPPINAGARIVFVAPLNTATNPRAAANSEGIPNTGEMKAPKLAPMENRGTISPP